MKINDNLVILRCLVIIDYRSKMGYTHQVNVFTNDFENELNSRLQN